MFGSLHSLIKRLTSPSAVEAGGSISEAGLPVVTARAEFGEDRVEGDRIYNGDYLGVLDRAVETTGLTVWVLFDRLDEAFASAPQVEVPALRALMRTYLDLNSLNYVRLKLFIRKDLFHKILEGGFVNLTHINA